MSIKFLPSISAVVLAAVVAGAFIVAPGTSDKVSASAPLNSGKSDRLDIRPLGTQCSDQAWPYFEASCMRDRRMALGRAKTARIVTTDRLDAANPEHLTR